MMNRAARRFAFMLFPVMIAAAQAGPLTQLKNTAQAEAAPAPSAGEPSRHTRAADALYIKVTANEEDLAAIQAGAASFERDDIGDRYITGYIGRQDLAALDKLGFRYSRTDSRDFRIPSGKEALKGYHTYETLTSELQELARKYPALASLTSIGKTVQGRDMWFMKISKNVTQDSSKPSVRLSAAMHGDEVVGTELTMNLISLLLENYGSDPRITAPVDNLEIWIMPSTNPDGTVLRQRYNAKRVDLNRNFPDFNSGPGSPAGRAPETVNMMNFLAARHFTLGANFHGGAVVVNMPWDTIAALPPDQAYIEAVSLKYSKTNEPMYASHSFPKGITNGYAWYKVTGGMQDWSYYYQNEIHLTIEVSGIKWPSGDTLNKFWDDNRESLLGFLESALQGVHGRVIDKSTKLPLAAEVSLQGIDSKAVSSDASGVFHKLALPGDYILSVKSEKYAPYSQPITIPEGGLFDFSVELSPL